LTTTSSQRTLRWGALLLLAALPAIPAHARSRHAGSHHSESWAHDRFAAAERMREALNGRPQADRTRRDYQRVLNVYRTVYYGSPTSTKADPSVVAVAETLVEMGRRFEDDKILKEAIGQYKFLRREYPGSKYRCDALFTIGEIYKDDLNDSEQAREAFREFLHRYPHNRLVDDAQEAIADLDRQIAANKKATVASAKKSSPEPADKSPANPSATNAAANAAKDNHPDAESTPEVVKKSSDPAPGHLPRVTGIRHWSTPDYTRVAIDLESDVKFGSQRIANPDRIFFDLRDTKLASTLVGKSFDVDDGFLKKIRVAQFQPGRTRVVLEVDDLSDYDAFLLPDPYRLIIDIHGKGTPAKDAHRQNKGKVEEASAKTASAAAENALDDAKTPAAKAGPKSTEPAAQSRVDALRAQAGSAPVTRQDVGDAAKITPRADASAVSEQNPARDTQKRAAISHEVPAPTKVVVEADDDDTAPVQTAKLDVPASSSESVGSPRHDENSPLPGTTSGSTDSEDQSRSHRPAASRARGKSASRLKSREKESDEMDVHEASPTARGDRSLIRALGLKIGKIVIDPGHGGHDTGTIGPNGLEEKDLVLEVGRKLGKLLESRLGAEVVYTRKDDTFIPLETRTAIANQQRADLFISIHANSSHDPAARGVETYYLNFTSSPEALEVAARENAVSEKSIYELQDLVKKIALKEKIEESREFAGDVQESLHSGLSVKSPGLRNRGVKKAPFIVLIGANMPSILAEISFVSNPGDERRLETSDYRQRIAESLYKGIAKYVNGLSGVKVASKVEKITGQ